MDLPNFENANRWWHWFSKRPRWQKTLVIIGPILVVGAWLVHNQVWSIPQLKETIGKKDMEIQRLETQLTPFRTIGH